MYHRQFGGAILHLTDTVKEVIKQPKTTEVLFCSNMLKRITRSCRQRQTEIVNNRKQRLCQGLVDKQWPKLIATKSF